MVKITICSCCFWFTLSILEEHGDHVGLGALALLETLLDVAPFEQGRNTVQFGRGILAEDAVRVLPEVATADSDVEEVGRVVELLLESLDDDRLGRHAVGTPALA